jgi:hypothetical protein
VAIQLDNTVNVYSVLEKGFEPSATTGLGLETEGLEVEGSGFD